jgi:hypothetical protein
MERPSPSFKQYLEKYAMGFIMGATAGATVGLLSGGFTVLRYGPQVYKVLIKGVRLIWVLLRDRWFRVEGCWGLFWGLGLV